MEQKDIIQSFLRGNIPSGIEVNSACKEEYKKAEHILSNPLQFVDKASPDTWLIPEEYQTLNVEKYVESLCSTEAELARVKQELALFKSKNLHNLLRLLIYLVDYMRKNKYVWGVGRGSSVSSYVLYLIGVHKIDSIKYNLDIKEFLKE